MMNGRVLFRGTKNLEFFNLSECPVSDLSSLLPTSGQRELALYILKPSQHLQTIHFVLVSNQYQSQDEGL